MKLCSSRKNDFQIIRLHNSTRHVHEYDANIKKQITRSKANIYFATQTDSLKANKELN